MNEMPEYVSRLIALRDEVKNITITPHFYEGRANWLARQIEQMDTPAFTMLLIQFLIKQLNIQASIQYPLESSDKRYFGEHEKGRAVLSALEHAKMLRDGGLEVKVNDVVVNEK